VNNKTELIPYSDVLTENGLKREFDRLRAAFPTLQNSFYLVLAERIKDSEYTDQQLHDAVNYLIDTCIYPQPTIANIMTFKNNVRLHTYTEICNMVDTAGKAVWDEYVAVDIEGLDKKVWVRKIDAKKYGL